MFHLTSFGLTNVGLERTNNEDAFHIAADAGLYVVCDGMGGHASGEVASKVTVDSMGDFATRAIHEANFRWPFNSPNATTLETRILDCAVRLANREVFNAAQANSSHRGMGTTIVAMLAGETQLGAVHVGDSRIYRLRDNKISAVTEDHSLLNHYLRTRPMTKEEIKNFKGKNVIVRAVGLREAVQPEVHVVDYRVGDRYLLCTDGLTDLVDDKDIETEMISADNGLEGAVTRLIERALRAGGKDNVTIVMMQVNASRKEDEPDVEDADDTSPGFDTVEGDGYWDQETMPAYEVGDVAKAVLAGGVQPIIVGSDDGFADAHTPMDSTPAPAEVTPDHVIPPPPGATAEVSATTDDIPPPPGGRAVLPEPINMVDSGEVDAPTPMDAPRSQAPAGLAPTPSQPLHPLHLGGGSPGSSRANMPPSAGSPFAAANGQSRDPAIVRATDPTAPAPKPKAGADYNPVTNVTPIAPMAAVVINANGVVVGDIGESGTETSSPVLNERQQHIIHADTARYKVEGDPFNIDSPTPLAIPVIRPEDLEARPSLPDDDAESGKAED